MFTSTKVIELGSCAFRQWRATHSHCQFIHGYQLKAKFWFGCSDLDEKNWAVDFGGLKELKQQLQHIFDHTYCVAADDPALPKLKELESFGAIQLRIFEKGVGIERAAEKCFELASQFLKEKYGDRCWVRQVEVFEHEDNSAIFCDCDGCEDREIPEDGISDTEVVKDEVPTFDLKAAAAESIPLVTGGGKLGAHVGPNVSTGKGDWFKGTTWGTGPK